MFVKSALLGTEHFLIEGLGASFWNGKRLPIGTFYHFSEQNNLAHMAGVVGHLSVDGFHNGVFLTTYCNFIAKVGSINTVQSTEQAFPALFPSR